MPPVCQVVIGLLVVLLTASVIQAAPYSKIVAFGDSLSDNGNAWVATNYTTPDSRYDDGRFSNGPVWVEHLADNLGISRPTARGLDEENGTNFAVGGMDSVVTLGIAQTYVNDIVLGDADPDALYTIWIGGNDFLYRLGGGINPSNINLQEIASSLSDWADNVSEIVTTLRGAGAAHFLVLNLPRLGDTPHVLSMGSSYTTQVNTYSQQFNTYLANNLDALENADPGLDITEVDIYSMFTDILASPSSFGFTNVAGTAIGTPSSASTYLFWDSVHPTTVTHSLIGQAAADALPTPEPTSLTLVLVGALFGLSVAARRCWLRRLSRS